MGVLLKPVSVDDVMWYSMIETYLEIVNPEFDKQFDRIGAIQCLLCRLDMIKQEDP